MSEWKWRETQAYRGIIMIFSDTSVPQVVTHARLQEVIYECESLQAALTDARKK